MSNRLVYTCITILRSLPSSGLNVGKVIEQTSSDRSHVIKAIEHLKKAKMVTKEEDPNHKQRLFVKPTSLALELRKVMNGMQEYNKWYSVLDQELKKRFQTSFAKNKGTGDVEILTHDKETLRIILKERGYAPDEIERSLEDVYETSLGIRKLLNQSPRFVINLLVFKYDTLLKFEPNQPAKLIIQNTLIDSITEVLKKIRVTHANITDEVINLLIGISQLGGFDFESMNQQVYEVMRSILLVLDPPKEQIKKLIESESMKGERKRQATHPYNRIWLGPVLSLFNEIINSPN